MKIKIVLAITVIGMLYTAWAIPDIIIRQEDVPFIIGTWSRFDQQVGDFEWIPFDSMRTWWDLTVYPNDNIARIKLLNPNQGIYPAPDTFPNAQVAELDTLGSGDVTWSYMSQTNLYLYIQGIDFSTGGYRFLGNYQPDYRVYITPMNDGAGWNTAWSWQCDIGIGFPYQASEQHQKVVVAKGKVRVPFSGNHFWPCLVIRDYMTYSDNFGTNDTRWIYEWVVPGRFSGANGVAAAQSINGGAQNFMIVDNFFKLNTLFIPGWDLRCPDFANTTIWPDTNYLGPFIVKTSITDSTGIGADSLFYRINSGPFLGAGHDSVVADDYFYTIPAVAQPCTLGYLLWAEDSFSVANAIDIWNTDPICAPESTYYKFITSTAVDEYGNVMAPPVTLTCAPNPFSGNLTVKFHIPNSNPPRSMADQMNPKAQISIRIYDTAGRLIKQFDHLTIQPFNQVVWSGSDDIGCPVPAGVYFIHLVTGGESVVKPVTLVR